jgi:hypothetical protein
VKKVGIGANCKTLIIGGFLFASIAGAPFAVSTSKVFAQSTPVVAPALSKIPEPKTTSTPTRNLAALVQPLWVDLTPAQQKALAPFAPKWNTFPTQEKRSWVKLADRFGSMTPEQIAKLQARMKIWAELSPEQRLRARANYNLASKLPQDQRIAEFEQYRGMTPEQRKILRSAGKTSNTAALYSGTRSGLAAEAAQPIEADGVSVSKPNAAPIKKSSAK